MDQSLRKCDFEPEPMGIIETLSECLHKLCAVFESFRWPYLHTFPINKMPDSPKRSDRP